MCKCVTKRLCKNSFISYPLIFGHWKFNVDEVSRRNPSVNRGEITCIYKLHSFFLLIFMMFQTNITAEAMRIQDGLILSRSGSP